MKKLFLILVLCFVWGGSVYAKDVKLLCEHENTLSSKVLIINDNKKSLYAEDNFVNVQNYSLDLIYGFTETIIGGKLLEKRSFSLDRRTGILTILTLGTNGSFHNKYECNLYKKNKF